MVEKRELVVTVCFSERRCTRVNYKSNIFYNNHDIRILVKYLLEKKINNKLMKMFIISEDILLLKGKFLGKTINILLNRCKVYLLVTVKKL